MPGLIGNQNEFQTRLATCPKGPRWLSRPRFFAIEKAVHILEDANVPYVQPLSGKLYRAA